MPLVIFGLLVSIPIIVWGSQLVLKLMDRFPIIITLGGMLLGWIAGTMAVTDPAIVGQVPQQAVFQYVAGAAGALLVLAVGLWRKRVIARRAAAAEAGRRARAGVGRATTSAGCCSRPTALPPPSTRRSGSSTCASTCASAISGSTWSTSSVPCRAT